MSYSGFEYDTAAAGFGGGFGGMDPMGGGFGDSGGGFMDSSSASKSPNKKANRDRQSLIPVSIKQLKDCTQDDDTFKLDGVIPLYHVKIIGTIERKNEQSTCNTYVVSDGTGVIECKRWIDRESNSALAAEDLFRENALVKIFGQLREYGNEKNLLIQAMSIVEDWNELTSHNLEIIMEHLKNTRGPIPGSVPMQIKSDPHQNNMAVWGAGTSIPPAGRAMQTPVKSESTDKRDLVNEVYKRHGHSDQGLHHSQVLEYLSRSGVKMQMHELAKIVDHLSSQGVLYSTIDESHFKSTEV